MKLHIKHMVSSRCKMYVKNELNKLGIKTVRIELGVVEFQGKLTSVQYVILKKKLEKAGFSIIEKKENILVERIKNTIINMIYHSTELPRENYSEYLSKKLKYNYTYLSNTFSKKEGIGIKKYIILHKIERAKELMMYNEMTLSEIASKLDYNSVAHLSNQFKKITNQSPSDYKKKNPYHRKNLESL